MDLNYVDATKLSFLVILIWTCLFSINYLSMQKVSLQIIDKRSKYETLPVINHKKWFQNWKEAGCLEEFPLEEHFYHHDMEIENFSRFCHFTTGFFQAPDEGVETIEDVVTISKLLYDLFDSYGILSSKRAGHMLGIFRSAGHLKGDSKSGDHYLFLPNSTTISLECQHKIVRKVVKEHGCATYEGFAPYFDGYEGINIWTDKTDWFSSHGTAFEANYLLLNRKKNEELARYGIFMHDAMRSLCFAPFNGILAMVFDTPHIQAQLRWYGDDFLIPQPGKKMKKEFQFIENLDLANLLAPNVDDSNFIYTSRHQPEN